MKSYEKLKELVDSMESDVKKFDEKGNAAAGTRVRKTLMEIKNLSHEMRKEIISEKEQ